MLAIIITLALFAIILICLYILSRLLSRIVCPECRDGDRPAVCPTCGDQGTVQRGSNPSPRGTGIRGPGVTKGAIRAVPHTNHSNGWARDRGDRGLIS